MALMEASTCQMDNWFRDDAAFQQLFPESIQLLADTHWTPLSITQKTVQFLVPCNDVRVLDIGSGVGKFCLGGAYYKPLASFSGVEQRNALVDHAEAAKNLLGLKNVCFMHRNFTQLNLKLYDHFYFYNSFHENLSGTNKIDDSIEYSIELYNYYSRYLSKQLEEMPVGTRIVTYCSWDDEIPSDYKLIESHFNSLLKCWMKTSCEAMGFNQKPYH